MNELCFSTDHTLRICSWGKEIAEFTGQSEAEIIGNKYFDVFPRIFSENKDALARVIREKKTLTLKKHTFHCPYGGLTADIKIKLVKSPDRKKDLVKVSLRPYSTCTVSQKLRQSKKLIDIGIIASTLAHGVRNPLNAIKGSVVYLREKYAGEDTLIEFTKIMEEEISRLEDFISHFLGSSVLETGARETDLNELLKKIEIFTSLQIYARNIQSCYEFGTVPPIIINSFHLEQAILNVINNAIEAMQDGGQLRIKTSTAERSGRCFVVIAISDTGPGISAKQLDALTSENRNNGRGFGFFITYEILKHYGGHIEIDSKKNVGTTITLFIPCQHAPREVQ
jgi:two-component system nitrogen regulation sensor histidine kinase GlnL